MVHLSYGLEDGCPLNFDKELDRLISLKIIGHRYSFLFEDVWFILLQYMYFEKFILTNFLYLGGDTYWRNPSRYLLRNWNSRTMDYGLEFEDVIYLMKNFGFMSFNLIFTAIISLGGLTTIPFCLKMIKQGKTKEKIFYILSFLQILLQTLFPFMRAGLVILNVTFGFIGVNGIMVTNQIREISTNCILVGFHVYFFLIQLFDSKQLKFNEMLFKHFT